MQTQRVELADGGYAVVRTTKKLGDTAVMEEARHERGFDSDYLDGLVLLRTRIIEWSKGPITDAAIRDLDDDDAQKIYEVLNPKAPDPNGSAPSSTGTPRTRVKRETTAENRTGSGEREE